VEGIDVGVRVTRALVTGASSGIGESFVRQLAARGVACVVVARREGRLQALADRIDGDIEVLAADLTDPAGRALVEARLAAEEAPVDLLVNNAGFGAYGAVADLPLERQAELVELNVLALVRCTRAVLPRLVAAGHGGIINVGSIAGVQPDPYAAAYGASKAFVRSFTEALHEEVRGSGVRVLLVAPGLTATEFQDAAGMQAPAGADRITMSADAVVAAALDDYAKGRATSVAGLVNRLAVAGAGLAPRAVTRRVSGALHRRVSHK
jgi:short-subunit dehydrogenase